MRIAQGWTDQRDKPNSAHAGMTATELRRLDRLACKRAADALNEVMTRIRAGLKISAGRAPE